MGRGKLTMELIEKEKSRMITYQKRIKGLKKKAEEFSTLCGVPTCMIIYSPRLKNCSLEVEIWPEEQKDFIKVVNMYKDKAFTYRGVKSQNLFHFLADRKRKVEDKIAKLRKSNIEAMFSSKWDDRLNSISLEQLKELVDKFNVNIEVAKKRIAMERGDQPSIQQLRSNSTVMIASNGVPCGITNFPNQQVIQPLHMQFSPYHNPYDLQPLQMVPFDLNPIENPTATVTMNGGDHLSSHSGVNGGYYNEVQVQPHHQHMYFDPTVAMVDDMTMNNPRAMWFYGNKTQPFFPYQQCTATLPSASPQIDESHISEFDNNDINPHEAKIERRNFLGTKFGFGQQFNNF